MKNKFASSVFVAVSQTVNTEVIKEKVKVVATRVIKGEKVLIILDDVWEELNLEQLGIPCGKDHMNCKILITSRNQNVCEAMNAVAIPVNILEEEEAWAVFARVVGRNEWNSELKNVALDIVKECGGLQLFLLAVGKALKNKDLSSWEAARDQLQDQIDGDAPAYKTNGIRLLKLSYERLESDVAKACFLLCSMFPEDEVIGLKRLTHYAMGVGMFKSRDINIRKAKSRVKGAVDLLKSSFLLLDVSADEQDDEQELFKMHDLVRDMAILIASESDDKFWVRSGQGLSEWQPEKHLESCKKISLMVNEISKLPDHQLLFPHLDTFLVQDNEISSLPDEFFRAMQKVRVLDMSLNNISTLPRSLRELIELHTLDLSYNKSLCEISVLGELTGLVILKLRCTGITNIPKEIGRLNKLRLLDVFYCKDLCYVAPNVVSKLIRLEELYVELKEDDGDCNFLVELSNLKSLAVLHLYVPELHYIPEDIIHSDSTLIEFDIHNIDASLVPTFEYHCRTLRLSKCNFPSISVMKLISVSNMLYFHEIKDLKNIVPDVIYPAAGSEEELRHICVVNCENVTSMVEISNERYKLAYSGLFSNLRTIFIVTCPSLLELFPLSVAQGLVNLRESNICDCESLVAIISAGDILQEEIASVATTPIDLDDDICIVFHELTEIILEELPKLESFYSGHCVIKYPSLKRVYQGECGSMKRWSYGKNEIPNIKFEYEGKQYNNINDYIIQEGGWMDFGLSAGK